MAIPKNTTIPKNAGQFMKLSEGKNRFRVLSDIRTGWEGWQNQKPFRQEGDTCDIDENAVDLNRSGRPNINYFWVMSVWNYEEKRIQVLQITQKTIMGPLYELEENPDWGDLKGYDVEIFRKKEGDRTTYAVTPVPPKPVSKEIVEAYEENAPDLGKLFAGEYPMRSNGTGPIDERSIPF